MSQDTDVWEGDGKISGGEAWGKRLDGSSISSAWSSVILGTAGSGSGAASLKGTDFESEDEEGRDA